MLLKINKHRFLAFTIYHVLILTWVFPWILKGYVLLLQTLTSPPDIIKNITFHQELLFPPKFSSSIKSPFKISVCHFIFLDFIYLFLERGEGREKERERSNVSRLERYINWLPLLLGVPREGGGVGEGEQNHNPGICPDLESNWWPSTLHDYAQPTEPH